MSDQPKSNDPKLSKKPKEVPDEELDRVAGGQTVLSNVSKTRSEISMTFARNTRA